MMARIKVRRGLKMPGDIVEESAPRERVLTASGQHVSLNLNVRGLRQSATVSIKDRVRALRKKGKTVYDFGLGQSPFPVPGPVVEALRLAAAEKDYLPVLGLPALRESVADYHRRYDQLETHPERILVGPGSKELMFLLQLVYYGEIILPTPSWVSYLPQARILGRRISLLHTTTENQWKITAQQLDESLAQTGDETRPRLLVLNYPMNPTGLTYAAEELKAIAEVARRYELIVLSDEIYGRLHFTGGHQSIARFYPERTIVSSGLSKWCGAGGWRLGTFAFPQDLKWLLDAMASVASETYTSVSAPIQHAGVTAFKGGAVMEHYLANARRILSLLGHRCVTELRAAGVQQHDLEGGFYLFPDFSPLASRLRARGIMDSAAFCERLLSEAGVAILPGSAFGRPRGEFTARLSFIDFDGARALAAAESVPLDQPLPSDFADRYCESAVTGVRKLAEWLQIPAS